MIAQGRAIVRPFIATPGLPCRFSWPAPPKAMQLHGPSLQRRQELQHVLVAYPQGRAIARPFIATRRTSRRMGRVASPRPCNCPTLHCNVD